MSIVKSNKVIAKYMGGKFSGEALFKVAPQNVWLPKFGVCRWDSVDLGKGKTLEYHNNWDWLKTVVDKIGKEDLTFDPLSSVSIYSSLEEVYKEVVDFINWKNNN